MGVKIDLLLKNARLPEGRVADVSVAEGTVVHIGAGQRADEVIDCTGHICLPGAIDMHVHMRDETQRDKEDWRTGSMSALAGGVTLVVDQPNSIPPVTNARRFCERVSRAREGSLCHFAINAGVMPGAALEEMWKAGAMAFGETFAAASSYGEAIAPGQLRDAMSRIGALGGLITIHAEEVETGHDTSLEQHDRLRPELGEAAVVTRITEMLPAGVRVHFCHLSSPLSIDAAGGTVEATPHHLFLSRELFGKEDGRGKVNPPLRCEETRCELWSRWDRIDVIASDHAPHTTSEKSGSFEEIPSGIPGVETMVPLLLGAVLRSRISLQSVIKKTVSNPAAILGISAPGFEPGKSADFALYPKQITKIEVDRLHSKAGWTPFEGLEAVFPDTVILGGDVAYKSGEFRKTSPHWVHGRGYIRDEDQDP